MTACPLQFGKTLRWIAEHNGRTEAWTVRVVGWPPRSGPAIPFSQHVTAGSNYNTRHTTDHKHPALRGHVGHRPDEQKRQNHHAPDGQHH